MENYKQITIDELQQKLENHAKWLQDRSTGERANFTGYNLCNFAFNVYDLSYAIFEKANLVNATFIDTNLTEAIFDGACLEDARFKNVNLYRTKFTCANLSCAQLRGNYLKETCFRSANLSFIGLHGATLEEVDFSNANLTDAHLEKATIKSVITDSTTKFFDLQCPDEGAFIGWKAAYVSYSIIAIVKLLILEDAKRSSAATRKCRCSKAKVLAIYGENGKEYQTAYSCHDSDFRYNVGEIVEVKDFDEDRWAECSYGIHFFITRKEAEEYGKRGL